MSESTIKFLCLVSVIIVILTAGMFRTPHEHTNAVVSPAPEIIVLYLMNESGDVAKFTMMKQNCIYEEENVMDSTFPFTGRK